MGNPSLVLFSRRRADFSEFGERERREAEEEVPSLRSRSRVLFYKVV